MSETLELARRFMQAAGDGDIDAARACFHPDAGIWHNFDNATQTVDENLRLLAWMAHRCSERTYVLHRQEEIAGGWLQQHRLDVVMNDGTEASTEALAVVSVSDGRITKIEEYLDPTPLAALATQEPTP